MKLHQFLPYESYTLITMLSAQEVGVRIANNVQPPQEFSFGPVDYNYEKPYSGTMYGNTFRITRNMQYRNSFRPVITGKIIIVSGQCQIKIKMALSLFVTIFMGYWLGMIALICFFITYENFSRASFYSFLMFAGGYLLVLLPFKYESRKSKSFLKTLLEQVEYNKS